MKNLRNILLSLGVLLFVVQFAFVSPVSAQSAKKLERERVKQIMQPTADIEAFRQEYLNYLIELEDEMRLLSSVPQVREKFSRGGLRPLETLAAAKRSVAEMPIVELTKMRAAYAKFPGWRDAARTTDSVIKPELRALLESRLAAKAIGAEIQTNAVTPDKCQDGINANVSNTDISAAKAAEIAAEAIMEALPTDALTFEGHAVAAAARAALQAVTLSLETLKAIKDDCEDNAFQDAITKQLTNSIANDNANTTTITTAINSAKTAIINNDNSNTTTITTNDNANKTAIINNDNANKTAIISNDNSNKDTIVNNDNANTVKITTAIEAAKTTIIVNANANKDELIRLHIAADLASTDGSTFVAAFILPAADGGYLELVRTIVAQTIAKLAGSKTSQANAFLQKGDSYRAAGDYKSAYAEYRKAYKTAQN